MADAATSAATQNICRRTDGRFRLARGRKNLGSPVIERFMSYYSESQVSEIANDRTQGPSSSGGGVRLRLPRSARITVRAPLARASVARDGVGGRQRYVLALTDVLGGRAVGIGSVDRSLHRASDV